VAEGAGSHGLAAAAAARRSEWSLRASLWMEVRKARALPSDMLEARMASERVEGVCPASSVRAAAESAGPVGRKRPLLVRRRTRRRYEVSGSRVAGGGASNLGRASIGFVTAAVAPTSASPVSGGAEAACLAATWQRGLNSLRPRALAPVESRQVRV
jgi:hypothetical protein